MKYWLPAVGFLVLVMAFGLNRNPSKIPSPLIGKPAPAFRLARLESSGSPFGPADMQGKVWLLNVWASWCVSCRAEHRVLRQLAARDLVPIVGLNYKDKPADARRWLEQFGDPYRVSVIDRQGRVGIDWGVYGVPETFLIDRHGVIRYKYIGPVDAAALTEELIPRIKTLVQDS